MRIQILLLLIVATSILFAACIDPVEKSPKGAERLLASIRASWYSVISSEKATFEPNSAVNSDALAESGGIQPEQICLSAGVFLDSDIWEEGSGMSSVRYTGTTKTDARFRGVCGRANRLAEADYLYEPGKFELAWFEECGCLDGSEQECCLLAVFER